MIDINILYEILLQENISLLEKEIFELIPELKFEKNFEQKSEWHCFDVWNHTLATIKACDMNVEDRLVMLLHDIGKPFSYQDDGKSRHFKGHAKKSAEMAKIILDRFNIDEVNKELIIKLIEFHSTKINDDDINQNNKDFYKRLLNIQKYDASGYEKKHSKMVLDNLKMIEKYLQTNYNL